MNSRYEFSLRQEVLLEKGAGILGSLSRYGQRNGVAVADRDHPINVMYHLVSKAKHDVLMAETELDLVKIEAQFDLAKQFAAAIGDT